MTIQSLIEQVCDADKRSSSESLQQVSEVIVIQELDAWCGEGSQINKKGLPILKS